MQLESNLLTQSEVAKLFKVSRTTIWRWINQEENPLPHIKIGNIVRFKREDVQNYITANAVG